MLPVAADENNLYAVPSVISICDNGIFFIESDNFLWACGNSAWIFGDSEVDDYTKPTKIMDNVMSVSAGENHVLVLKNDGSLWSWGNNSNGQLGDGSTNRNYSPQEIMTNVIFISAGSSSSFAIKEDGSVWSWGYNYYGQLGDGSTENKQTPVKVFDNAVSVAADYYHTLILRKDGVLFSCGKNYNNESSLIKNGDNILTPQMLIDGVKSITAFDGMNGIISNNGTLWVWGRYWSNLKSDYPNRVGTDVKCVSLGSSHIVALSNNNDVTAWGNNKYGQLGLPDTENTDDNVDYKNNIENEKIYSNANNIKAYKNATYVINENGELYACGDLPFNDEPVKSFTKISGDIKKVNHDDSKKNNSNIESWDILKGKNQPQNTKIISDMAKCGIIPQNYSNISYNEVITKAEFYNILMNVYRFRKFGADVDMPGKKAFKDTENTDAEKAYSLQIAAASGVNAFDPNAKMTKEVAAYGLYRLYYLLNYGEINTYDNDEYYTNYFQDIDKITKWTRYSCIQTTILGIMTADDDSLFNPKRYITREEAVQLAYNVAWLTCGSRLSDCGISMPAPDVAKDRRFYGKDENTFWKGEVYLYIKKRDNYSKYIAEFYSNDKKVGEKEVSWEYCGIYGDEYTKVFENHKEPIKIKIKIYSVDPLTNKQSENILSLDYMVSQWKSERDMIYNGKNGYKDADEASKYMTTVTVPCWTLVNGEKESSTKSITVNAHLAEDVVNIFKEIYNGSEKFPIKDIGGFAWRASNTNSAHCAGAAIDINSNEIYQYNKETKKILAGSLWEPDKNPYSIKPNGDVVKAFQKYGWVWGGIWSGTADYMHFSYLGN